MYSLMVIIVTVFITISIITITCITILACNIALITNFYAWKRATSASLNVFPYGKKFALPGGRSRCPYARGLGVEVYGFKVHLNPKSG